MMIVPDNQGDYWSNSDLEVHQDSRTTDKMTLNEARKLLSIADDAKWEALIADHSLTCTHPTPAFDRLAALLIINSVRSQI